MGKQKRKSRWIKRILLLLLVVLAAGIAWVFLSPTLLSSGMETQYLAYQVENRDIRTSLNFSGTVEILHTQQITTQQGQTVREVYVESSDTVKKDDRLLQLESGEVLTSNMDGVVNQVRAKKGGYAVPGQTLVQVCDLTNLQITMTVDEYDIAKLCAGLPCQVYFLALDQRFDAEISHINKVSDGTGGMAYYTVTIEFTAPEDVLPGMQASVSIPREEELNVPALPVEAVSFENREAFVYVDKNGTKEKTPVVLGLNDAGYVQLLDGPEEGETVYAVNPVKPEVEEVTLASLYQKVFGKTIVINEPRQRGGNGSQGGQPAEGMEMPGTFAQPGGGQAAPEGGFPPEWGGE